MTRGSVIEAPLLCPLGLLYRPLKGHEQSAHRTVNVEGLDLNPPSATSRLCSSAWPLSMNVVRLARLALASSSARAAIPFANSIYPGARGSARTLTTSKG